MSYVLTIMLYTGLTIFNWGFYSLPDTTADYIGDSGVHTYRDRNLELPFYQPITIEYYVCMASLWSMCLYTQYMSLAIGKNWTTFYSVYMGNDIHWLFSTYDVLYRGWGSLSCISDTYPLHDVWKTTNEMSYLMNWERTRINSCCAN